MFRTPKRNKTGLNGDNIVHLSPSRVLLPKCINTTDKECNGSALPACDSVSPGEGRRGRPRAEFLNALILEGSVSPSSIKCTYCGRVFPREKSLQAHLRTHTGDKPYVCNFPRCGRKFAQSGQLKTHERLHTGEKPFMCSFPNCPRRFTHANRHCPDHPDIQLKRDATPVKQEGGSTPRDKKDDEKHKQEVKVWMEKHKRKEHSDCSDTETTPKKRGSAARAKLFTPEPKPQVCELPKKRWLREASALSLTNEPGCSTPRNAVVNDHTYEKTHPDALFVKAHARCDSTFGFERIEYSMDEVRAPLKPRLVQYDGTAELDDKQSVYGGGASDVGRSSDSVATSASFSSDMLLGLSPESKDESYEVESFAFGKENEVSRPTVLYSVRQGQRKNLSNDELQSAFALVELKNGTVAPRNYRI